MTQNILKPDAFEGSWDEILAQGANWTGQRVRVSILDGEKSSVDRAVEAPTIGSGTFEEIMALVQSFAPKPTDEENLLDAIEENRTLRRQLAEERNR